MYWKELPARAMHILFSDDKEKLVLEYENTIEFNNYDEIILKETYIKKHRKKCMTREIEREVSLIGPHRADVSFRLNDLESKNLALKGKREPQYFL